MIPHNKPTFDCAEKEATARVISSGWVASGQEVRTFEDEFCHYLGIDAGHAVAVSSCTAATYMALCLLGAKGAVIAYPAYTCTAVRNATEHIGNGLAIDSDIVSPNISIKELNKSNVSFVVVPHMYGKIANVSQISNSLIVIEDCAQALGAVRNGISVGLAGHVGVFSFYATKIMTSGGMGGMIVSKDKHIIDLAKDYRDFDQKVDNKRRFNFQMTDLQASIGREQLKKLPKFIKKRQEIYNRYMESGLNLLALEQGDVPYRAIWLTDDIERKIGKLGDKGIRVINPLEEVEIMADCNQAPNAFLWATKTISLPLYPSLSKDEVNYIICEVKRL